MSLKDGVGSTVGAMRSALVSVSPASDLRCCSSAALMGIWLGKGKQGSTCRGISVTRRFVSLQFAHTIKKLQTVAFVRPPSIRHQSFRGLYACRSVLRSTGSRVFVCDANLAPSLCQGWRPEGFSYVSFPFGETWTSNFVAQKDCDKGCMQG